ncbi:transcription factor TFIIIB subunit brf1 [Rhodotorula toruloides]
MICTSCGEDSVLEMTEHAQTVCTRCGTVLSENAIVSEIQFGETGSGAAMVQGSYVGADQTRARAPGGFRQRGVQSQESREQTLANGRRRIMELATGLRLSEHLQNVATRFFNLAVNMSFTKGRRTQYVAAACLYAACRQANGTQMLIDFSDLLEINVFVLGSTYLKLVRQLNINIPVVDPVIYITRFAALLDFGEETQKVALDATRLVNRMGRDWMQIGRRPSGICGACLLLAARMNNFRRSIEEVVQVVKIADVTLRKRLAEFKETASGNLTVSDFRSIWLEETHDPPAYAVGLKKEEEARKEQARKMREDSIAASETDSVVGDRAFRELAEREATAAAEDDIASSSPVRERARGKENEMEVEGAMLPPPKPSAKALGKRKRVEPEEEEEGGAPLSDAASEREDVAEDLLEGDGHEQYDAVIEVELQNYLGSNVGVKLSHELESQEQQRRAKISQSPAYELDTNDSLEGLDEDELDAFICTEEEVQIKAKLWMEHNKEYLKELAEKQTGPDGELKPINKRPRKKTKPRDGANPTGLTAADATTKMLEKKKFSKKINYDAIKNLFASGDSDAGSTYGGDDDEGDTPLIGQTYGRKGSRVGTPIVTPEPTWRQGSRAPSEAPSVNGRSALGREAAHAAQEDEGEEEDHEPEQREEDDEGWRSQFATQAEGDEEEFGYDEV